MSEPMSNASLSFAVALATIALGGALLSMAWRGAATNARQSALTLLGSVLAMLWMGAAYRASHLKLAVIGTDIGLIISLTTIAGVTAIAGMLDRTRPTALIFCGLGAAVAIIAAALPYFDRFQMLAMPGAALYATIIIAGIAHAILLTGLPAHPVRFTREGQYRHTAFAHWPSFLTATLLAIALLVIGWRMQAFSGVNSVFYIYASLIASIASAFAAMLVAQYRQTPGRAIIFANALPAGALIVAALPYAEVGQVIAIAGIAGAFTTLTREGLIALRIDEPSGTIASLLAPAIIGWLAVGCLMPETLAIKLQLLGYWLATGLALGLTLTLLTRTLTGLRISSRLLEEGMDIRIAAP